MLLAALFAFEAAGTLDVSDTVRGYARDASAGDGAAIDLENMPALELALDWPTSSLALEYAPRLLWSDVEGPEASPTLLLHSGGLRLSSRSERLSVSLAQTFAVGDQSFARLRAERGALESEPGAPELELLPAATVLRVVAAESSASLRYAWSRRVSTELRPSLGISGGADAAAQRALPRQRTARLDTSLDFRASLRDALSTTLGLAQTSISNGYDHRLVSLMETWSRTFGPESGSALGAGVALQESTGPDGSSSANGQPVGAASAWHTLFARAATVHVRCDLGYEPHLNVLTGGLQRRLFASAGTTTEAGDTTAQFTLGAAQTLPLDEPDAARSLSADLLIEQALLDWLSAQLAGQLVWQRLGGDGPLASSDSLWLVFAGARGELPSVRF